MNPLDWLLVALVAYSTVRAAMRGLLREAFALTGLVAGFFLACREYLEVSVRLQTLIGAYRLDDCIAFLLVMIATMLVATLLGKLLSRTASAVGLGFFDRLAGAAFGAARGVLLGLALLVALTALLPLTPWQQNFLQTSSLAAYFFRADHAVSFVMPSDLRLRLLNGVRRLRGTHLY